MRSFDRENRQQTAIWWPPGRQNDARARFAHPRELPEPESAAPYSHRDPSSSFLPDVAVRAKLLVRAKHRLRPLGFHPLHLQPGSHLLPLGSSHNEKPHREKPAPLPSNWHFQDEYFRSRHLSPGSSGYARTDTRYRREVNSWGRFRDARERWGACRFAFPNQGV